MTRPVITKHKDLSERFVSPATNELERAAGNLFLYGLSKAEIIGLVRARCNELEDAGIPDASPADEDGASISEAEPEVAEGE